MLKQVLQMVEFITTKIQFNVKLFGDKHCQCNEGWLFIKHSNIWTNHSDIKAIKAFRYPWKPAILDITIHGKKKTDLFCRVSYDFFPTSSLSIYLSHIMVKTDR